MSGRTRKFLFSYDALAVALLLLLVFIVARPSLTRTDVDGLDTAHHLMDGYFFNDLIHDHPHAHFKQYVFDYYRQYPALGFIFWPPLFPFVLGLFCLVGGAHVLTARICMLFFGAVFACALYRILRRRFTPWLAFATVTAAITVPGISWSFNQIMLELPTLAMMCIAIIAYQHLVDKLPARSNVFRAVLCAAAFAAIVYTKQPSYFLYGALLFDFLLLHRRYLRKPEIWLTLIITAVFCVPLLLFTLTFGHADLAQSVGHNTQLILGSRYKSLPRWSFATWTYYPRLAYSSLNIIVVVCAMGAMLLAVLRRDFLKGYAIWIGWLVLAYATFSYYDNKLPRHATFWWPAWIVLAGAFVQFLTTRMPRKYAPFLPVLLLLAVPTDMVRTYHRNYTDYRDERPAVAQLFAHGEPGNLLLFGKDKQVFVALVREDDPSRQVHVIRGDELAGSGEAVAAICRNYRIREVLVEMPLTDSIAKHPDMDELLTDPAFLAENSSIMLRAGVPYKLLLFHYAGPVAAVMAPVPLSSKLM